MNYLFKVADKETYEVVMVYNIQNNKTGFPHFLIYEANQWKYVSAKHFIPLEVICYE